MGNCCSKSNKSSADHPYVERGAVATEDRTTIPASEHPLPTESEDCSPLARPPPLFIPQDPEVLPALAVDHNNPNIGGAKSSSSSGSKPPSSAHDTVSTSALAASVPLSAGTPAATPSGSISTPSKPLIALELQDTPKGESRLGPLGYISRCYKRESISSSKLSEGSRSRSVMDPPLNHELPLPPSSDFHYDSCTSSKSDVLRDLASRYRVASELLPGVIPPSLPTSSVATPVGSGGPAPHVHYLLKRN